MVMMMVMMTPSSPSSKKKFTFSPDHGMQISFLEEEKNLNFFGDDDRDDGGDDDDDDGDDGDDGGDYGGGDGDGVKVLSNTMYLRIQSNNLEIIVFRPNLI